MKLRFAILVIAASLAMQSCFDQDMHAPDAVFEVSDVLVPADTLQGFGKGTGTVTAIVPVRSTARWSASIVNADSFPWLRIVSQDGFNPAGADITGTVRLSCADNPDAAPRSATMRFVTAGGAVRDITVTQRAKTGHIAIDGKTSYDLEAEDETAIKVKVLCNTNWTATLDAEASTCGATIEPSEGYGEAVVTIKPDPNYDCIAQKVAIVCFYAAGGDSVSFSVTREPGTPFIYTNPVDMQQSKLPGATSGTLRFDCNSPWKAEILESNIKDFSLESQEGEGKMNTEIPFTMSANEGDESLEAKVKLFLKANAGKSVVLTVTHWSGFSLHVDFSKVSNVMSCPLQPAASSTPQIPFTTSTGLNSGDTCYDYKFVQDDKEYVFGIRSSLINIAGTGRNGYIRLSQGYVRFPAVEGYKLAYVEFTTAATDKYYSIAANPEGTVLVGSQKKTGKEETVSWELNSTEYNKSYYEIISSSNTRQHNLILLYVK